MVKFSIYSGVWILTILLLLASVTRTEKYNITSTLDNSSNHYHYNRCCHQYRGRSKNYNYFFISFTHVSHDTIIFPNERYHGNNLQNRSLYSKNALVSNSSANVSDYYANDIHHVETKPIFAFNESPEFIKKKEASGRDHEDYLNWKNIIWRRRTLCSVSDDEQYVGETPVENVLGDVNKKEKTKTLLDYDDLVFMNDLEDPDSLKPHIRVKRSKSESNSDSSFVNRQDYLKDLASSFPRNYYESMDENSYDDDVSLDAKREIKSQAFFANDEQPIELHNQESEKDQSKMFDSNLLRILSSPNIGRLAGNTVNERSVASEKVANVPSDVKANSCTDKTSLNQDIVSLERPSDEYASVVNQRSPDLNSEILGLPEDPMVAVELVRKKRNNRAKAEKKRNLREPDQKTKKSFSEEKRSVLDPEKSSRDSSSESSSRRLSKLAIADLKADLLRLKRTAKNDQREKRLKAKKKKKHAEKKKNISSRSAKSLRSKNRSRLPREKNNGETRSGGKSNVGFASVASKKNNDNNFRRRSVKSKDTIERIDPSDDRSSIRDALSIQTGLKQIEGNEINADRSEILLAAQRGNDPGDVVAETDESSDDQRVEEEGPLTNYEKSRIPTIDGSKLRTKRDRNPEGNHGFLNEEDELRYYEEIREPEEGMVPCANLDDGPPLEVNDADGKRAVRSIDEVKELVKKLVTKVNELDNYLNVDEVNKNEKGVKKIRTRAIDDLCSNVSTGCAAFKEMPKIVQRCVPSTDHRFTSTTKTIVERKAEESGNTDEHKRLIVKSDDSEKGRSTRQRATRTLSKASKAARRESSENQKRQNSKWGRWTDWSSCSVTCGKGRQIRWRYCLHDCSTAETEMEEKACQLPACPPGKFLGIF
ncbi:uncharacterized protein LOC128884673 [Hylaeus volcanicus]|uniref:uncharacterized protein LOC128884673 n=1 Tax=Hylaeus volcanicus TaxID=313075 RepID=UPI0023B7A167|nr:uncharacterized protein LOC128884673 [Hylaeus volcanicus]